MKRFLKFTGLGLVILLILVIAVYLFLYAPKFSTMASVRKLTNNKDYNLYTLDYSAPYKLDEILGAGASTTASFSDLAVKTLLPGIPFHAETVELGCSCCFAADAEGNYMMGRNFDLEDTSAVLIHTKPKDGYESIGFADPGFTGINDVSSLAGRVAGLMLPYTTLDGMNEKGFACCMLWLDDKPTRQSTGKTPITTTVAMRLLLDRAANVDEAIAILRSYDMCSVSGGDYHFLLTDMSGRSVVVEWPEPSDEMVIVENVEEVTNFFLTEVPEGVAVGHGQERYEAIRKIIEDNDRVMNVDTMLDALESAQQTIATDISGVTQWSNVYELNKGLVHTVFRRDWDHVYDFSFSDFAKN